MDSVGNILPRGSQGADGALDAYSLPALLWLRNLNNPRMINHFASKRGCFLGALYMKLGLVTYQLAQSWDIDTLIENCTATGFSGVELRTEHAHGVEPTMSKAERINVKKRFEDSPVRLVGLGSTCEYHAADTEVVHEQIDRTKQFVELARDVGALGVKVRPNGLQLDSGIPKEKTLEQIGKALAACGDAAKDAGVEIWLEVHGRDTAHPPHIQYIMEVCDHPSVGVCWNSNPQDVKDGTIEPYFNMLQPWLRTCHIHDLFDASYPYAELISLLKEAHYDRYALAEISASSEPVRLMRYYAALWRSMGGETDDF